MHSVDTAKLVIITLCLVFLVMIALHEASYLAVFSASYLADGFCVANKHLHPALQGHAIAFYGDALMALCMASMVKLGREQFELSEAALTPIAKNMISLFGHGCGHLFLAVNASTMTGSSMVFENLTMSQQLLALIGLFPVWYGFMRDKRRSIKVTCRFAMAHNSLQVFFLPTRFFFTHVLMAVLLNSAVRWLSRDPREKTKYYAMESWLVDVPIVLASFFEAFTCDAFLIRYGGHLWFDMVVPIMFGVYFAILVYTGDGKNKKATIKPSAKQRWRNLALVFRASRALGTPAALRRSVSDGVVESLDLACKSPERPSLVRQLSAGLANPRCCD